MTVADTTATPLDAGTNPRHEALTSLGPEQLERVVAIVAAHGVTAPSVANVAACLVLAAWPAPGIEITNQQVAEVLGCHRNTVILAMNALAEAGLVRRRGTRVFLPWLMLALQEHHGEATTPNGPTETAGQDRARARW